MQTDQSAVVADRFVREPECKHRSGLSRTQRWRLEKEGKFPKRRKISDYAVGWLDSELTKWLNARADQDEAA